MAQPAVDTRRSSRQWIRILSLGLLALGLAMHLVSNSLPRAVRLVVPLEPLTPGPLRPSDSLSAAPGALAGANVLLVTLDTTRPDRLHFYGNDAIRTPTLDRLAERGVVFVDALAVAPTTLPAHASILTGRYPHHHGARINGATSLAEHHLTLAELLSQHGYRTGAFVSSFVLDERFGLAQGFSEYDDEMTGTPATFSEPQRSATETTSRALAWLGRRTTQPFFAWVHYMDPHSEFRPPPPFAAEYGHNPYDGEIAYVDEQLGRLLDGVGEETLANTLVVVVADHGEGLGHHGEYSHGLLLHEAALRVPLIFRLPNTGAGAPRGLRVDTPVSQVDIMPTILSLLGIAPEEALAGIPLTAPPPSGRALFAETRHGLASYGLAPLAAVYQGGLKYVHGPSPELYDRASDPLETKDLYPLDARRAEPLLKALRAELGTGLEADPSKDASRNVSTEEREKLHALGYVIGETDVPVAAERRLDPNTMISVLNEITLLATTTESDPSLLDRARYWLFRDGLPPTPALRIERLEAIAEEHPTFIAAHHFLASVYERNGRPAEAQAASERADSLRR